MTATYGILIDNSDNRLSQLDWSKYIDAIANLLAQRDAVNHHVNIHFFGYSAPQLRYQTCYAVIEGPSDPRWVRWLEVELGNLAYDYRQDSIALVAGHTTLIEARK
jgi:hypothetical protein